MSQKVVIEGLIGVGKSRLTSKFVDKGYVIYPEFVPSAMLKLFYEDMKKYAFTFQLFMMSSRIFQSELSLEIKERKTIFDRGPIGDYVFAIVNYIQGNITYEEFEVYFTTFQERNFSKHAFMFDRMIYLHVEPSITIKRIAHRSRDGEEHIMMRYLTLLEQVYFSVMLYLSSISSQVLFADWTEYGEVEDVIEKKLCKQVFFEKSEDSMKLTKDLDYASIKLPKLFGVADWYIVSQFEVENILSKLTKGESVKIYYE
jgi:deoxyadenosine/deoxycytidine kinase